jgi:hypothetical protein
MMKLFLLGCWRAKAAGIIYLNAAASMILGPYDAWLMFKSRRCGKDIWYPPQALGDSLRLAFERVQIAKPLPQSLPCQASGQLQIFTHQTGRS